MLSTACFMSTAHSQEPAGNDTSGAQQDFNLFESVNSNSGSQQLRSRSTRGNRNTATEPEFTLVGTSRVGSKYSVILRHRDGSEVVVKSSGNSRTVIEGYSQFSVVDINAGKVSIQYPGNTSCVESRDKGVSCDSASNIALLGITNSAPIQRAVKVEQIVAGNLSEEPGDNSEIVALSEESDEPDNPFAALRARVQAAGGASGDFGGGPRRGFSPRRIDPSDVPPGMRIISTPFGDRLVEQ